MRELDEIESLLMERPVLSLDLETTAPEGEPADEALNPRKAQIYLVALAAGRGSSIKSYALPPTPDVLLFVQNYMKKEGARVVGHNLINYDLEVLHYRDVVKFPEIKARTVDTLPLVWMLDEAKTTDRGLKASAKRYLGTTMTTFDEAFISSPNAMEIGRLHSTKKAVAKTLAEQLRSLKKCRSAEKKKWLTLLKERYHDRRDKASREEKKKYLGKIERYIARTFGEQEEKRLEAATDAELKRIDEKIAALTIAWEAEKVTYAADDSRRTLQLYGRVRGILEKKDLLRWADIELKNKTVCTAMQIAGMHVDVDRLNQLDQELTPLVGELESKLYDMAKCDFNPRSSKQLTELLFETLGVPPVIEKTKKWNKDTGEFDVIIKEIRNTNEKTLARIAHPFVQALLNYRVISKLHSTYVVALRQRAMEDPEWRIHAIFNSTGTVTGRYSSSDPNLQNIPSRAKPNEYDERVQELGPRLRWVFCAPKGKKLICADLSQIELRLIAQVTGDTRLLEIYNQYDVYEGLKYYTGDVHEATSKSLGVPRKLAKNLNFGLCYGMGAAKFARYARLFVEGTRDWDVVSAAKFRNMFLDEYEGIPATLEDLQEMIDAGVKQFRLLTGRYRHFKDNENVYGGKAFNSIIQGSAADLLKIVMWNIYETIICNPAFEGTRLVLQVHDEVGLEVPEDLAPAVGIMVKYIMERPWFNLDVPVLASVKVCDDWSQKDDDYTPEVGVYYARLKDGTQVTDKVFTAENWKEYADFEVAAKKDAKAKKPPEEAKSILIKPAVAMLTRDQEAWAATHLTEVPCYSV